MAAPKRIRVMISSRCLDEILFNGKQSSLSDVRKAIKADLEAELLLGSELFEVWINEDAPPAPGKEDSWETCMRQVKEADVVLALYNGIGGWADRNGEIGICHGELQTALAEAPGKVWLIELPLAKSSPGNTARDTKFQQFVSAQALFRGSKANTGEEAVAVAKQALREAVSDLVRLGVREASRGKLYAGTALNWSRLDYEARRKATIAVIRDSLETSGGKVLTENVVIFELNGSPVLLACDSVPAGMSVAHAREMVGQPFLKDHQKASFLQKKVIGPVHVIACQKSVSESQAISLLGFPDATIVSAPFGIYMADNVQKIQIVLIKDCRDPTSTNVGLQRFMTWLRQTGEDILLVHRAKARTRIVKAIAATL
jgi:hypothetical protein